MNQFAFQSYPIHVSTSHLTVRMKMQLYQKYSISFPTVEALATHLYVAATAAVLC